MESFDACISFLNNNPGWIEKSILTSPIVINEANQAFSFGFDAAKSSDKEKWIARFDLLPAPLPLSASLVKTSAIYKSHYWHAQCLKQVFIHRWRAHHLQNKDKRTYAFSQFIPLIQRIEDSIGVVKVAIKDKEYTEGIPASQIKIHQQNIGLIEQLGPNFRAMMKDYEDYLAAKKDREKSALDGGNLVHLKFEGSSMNSVRVFNLLGSNDSPGNCNRGGRASEPHNDTTSWLLVYIADDGKGIAGTYGYEVKFNEVLDRTFPLGTPKVGRTRTLKGTITIPPGKTNGVIRFEPVYWRGGDVKARVTFP